MDMNKKMNVRRINAFFAILIAAIMMLAIPTMVLADTEPNDSFASAEPTVNGANEIGTLNGMADTYDYYSIHLNSGDTLLVNGTLNGVIVNGRSFTLTIYSPSKVDLIAQSGFSMAGQVNPLYVFTYLPVSATGTYYIEIFADGVCNYTFTTNVTVGFVPPVGTGDIYVGGPSYVSGQPLATLPTLRVGDSAYFGGITDIGEEYKAQIDEALQNLSNMGFDVNYDISGGLGAYMGWEVVSNNTEVNGNTCYDIQLMGALAINFGLEGSVEGSMDLGTYGGTVTVDGSGSGLLKFEAILDGHLYLTVDEMAIAKLQLKITAEGHFEANVDATAKFSGQTMVIKADATADIEGVQIDFLLEFNPPLDVFQYGTGSGSTKGIYEGKEWYVPAVSTDVSGSITAQGTISYDVNAEITGEVPVDESNTTNLANEIGDNNFSETIPGGQYGGTMFTCTDASGNIFIIETEMGDAFGMMGASPFPGTRQMGGLDPASMMPSTGMQLDKDKGMITGMTVNGEAMTSEVPKAEVENFVESPMAEVTAKTGGSSTGMNNLMLILVIVIVIVVVILVVVMVAMRKKTPPQQQQPPQPMYQQPPPPPQQYPPQDQYGQQQQYQQPGQYPPPPPPQGQ